MKFQKRKITRELFINEEGQIDLASIMVGIIVIGLIGGIIAASLFAIIPWAHDNAAKNQLDSVNTAEQASKAKDGAYQNTLSLAANKYLPTVKNLVVTTDLKGECYVAVVKSESGKLYWESDTTKEQEYVPGSASVVKETCVSVSSIANGLSGSNQAASPVGNDPSDVDHGNSLFNTSYSGGGQLGTEYSMYDDSNMWNSISIAVPHTGFDIYDISKMTVSPYANKLDGAPYGVTGTISQYSSGTEDQIYTPKSGSILVEGKEIGTFGLISYLTIVKDQNPKVSSDILNIGNIKFNSMLTLDKFAKIFDGTSKIKIDNNVWTIPKADDALTRYDATNYTSGSHSYASGSDIEVTIRDNGTSLAGIVADYKPSDITGTSLDFYVNKLGTTTFTTKADYYYSSTGNDADFVKVASTPATKSSKDFNSVLRIGDKLAGYMVRNDGAPLPLSSPVGLGGKWKIVTTLSNGDTYSFTGKTSQYSQYQ